MKKFVLIVSFLFSSFTVLLAQDDENSRGEKIEALKIAFITQKLELSTDEAQKFWPVYNQYDQEIRNIKGGEVLDNEERLLNIRKKYKPSFERILGPKKLNNLFNAERDFRTVLIRRLKNRAPQKLNGKRR